MQNRYWIVVAFFDIFVACISIAYIGNRKEKADLWATTYTINSQADWTDAIGGCNMSCKADCHPDPINKINTLDDMHHFYLLVTLLNVYAFSTGVGMLGMVSEQLNCKQTCVMQCVLAVIAWLCSGWTYRWGPLPGIVLSGVALVVQSFAPLFFNSIWNKRNDLSFTILVFMQVLVSLPILIAIYNFSRGQDHIIFVVMQFALGVALALSMLAWQISEQHPAINQSLMLVANLGLFYLNSPVATLTMLSSNVIGFVVPLYSLIILTPDVRYMYGAEVTARFVLIMCLLYEIQ